MEVKYKAFISYRHLPLDKGVAIKLHHAIEHFSIPKALRKNGEKTPGRVFRDQDELPISSDLSGDIERALDNSEFLIVICSKETKNSKWVLREISYFLEHHDRSHVLAVLVEGTPEESFPEELTDEYSEEGKYIRSVEPLAANIVADSSAKRNALFRTEKLRIMAALIGCTYDSLYKREQRYVIRRIATAAAVVLLIAAGFIGVLLNRNAMITKNYENTLRSQSTYLANASQALLKEGDRLGAIALAIEALPSEGNDRPLVPCAQRALDEAVNAYLSPYNAASVSLISTGIISSDNSIMKFEVEPESGLVCAVSLNGSVSLWDEDSCKQLWRYETGQNYSVMDTQFIDSKTLIIMTSHTLLCMNTADSSIRWQVSYDDINTDPDSVFFVGMQISENKQKIYAFDEISMFAIDTTDGSVISRTRLPMLEEEGEQISFVTSRANICVSDDDKYVSLLYGYGKSSSWYTHGKEGICVMRTENLEPVFTMGGFEYEDFGYEYLYHDDQLLFTVDAPNGGRETYNFNNGELGSLAVETKLLICADLNSGSVKWMSEHSYCFPSKDSLVYWNLPDGTEIIIFTYSNHVDILNASDGSLIAHSEFYSVVRAVEPTDNYIQVVCQDGRIGRIWFDELQIWYYQKQFKEGVVDCKINDGYYWILGDNEVITRYSAAAADPSWVDIPVKNREESYPSGDYIISDDGFVMFSSYDLKVICGNKDGLSILYLPNVSVEDNYGYSTYRKYYLKALEGNQRLFSWTLDDSHGVLYLDIFTGEFREVTCDTELRASNIFRKENKDGWYLLAIKQESFLDDIELHFMELDDEMNIKREMILEDKVVSSFYDIHSFYDGNGRLYVHYENIDKTYQIDVKTLTDRELPDDFSQALNDCYDNFYDLDGNVYFDTKGNNIIIRKNEKMLLIYDNNGELVQTFDAAASAFVSLWFSPDGHYMFTLETDANLRRYAVKDWSLLSCKPLKSDNSVSLYDDILWQDINKDFFCLNVGEVMHLISKEDYEVCSYIPDCYGYMGKDDFFLCREGSYDFGGFPRHTTESLIEYGKEILNGWELSSEQKYEYGLD